MVGLRRWLGLGVVAAVLGACGSAGLSPKAFERSLPPPAAEIQPAGALDMNAEPVVIAPEVLDGWDFLYRFITETEFVLCLEGSKQDGRIVVDGFRLARMEATSVNSVRYQPCNSPRYVGTAHNHPPVDGSDKSLCYQSEPDRRSFGMDPRAVVDVVLCGNTKFRWWLKDGRTAVK
ncbi:MAG: hypothetical protein ACT4O1_15225 [Gemmatimonadota bacterium]